MPERTCQCGRTFNVAHASTHRKYCSDECRRQFTIVPSRQFTCAVCGVEFEFKGRTRALYCPPCRKVVQKRRVERYKVEHGLTEKLGVGSGGNQRGAKNHRHKDYAAIKSPSQYRKICYTYWDRACVLCGATKGLEVNHIDKNSANNDPHNLVPLCRSCHRSIHKLARRANRACEDLLFFLWPDGRIKIAEKIGDAEKPIRGEGEE